MADGIAPFIEEPAILFANGQVQEALAALLRSVHNADLGAPALQAWLMLFDLYQHLGMRPEFEALTLEFVDKFERSPPAWLEPEPRADPALATGGIAYCEITGTLSGASAPEMEKMRSAAAAQPTVRIDCSRLQGLDGPGCRLFRDALLSVRDSGKAIVLSGESQILRLLDQECQPGRVQTDGAVWALFFDVCRLLDLKDKFEEAAVNYAVTFEMSPPSWETQVKAAKGAARERRPEPADQALVLSGEVTGADAALARRLQDWAVANKMLVIDMAQVPRVDFVSAGLMLNVLSKLSQAGTTIHIRSANELVHALFRVMRMDKVARIIPRK
jgi:anti-anti-sigma regulatory factor